MKQVDHGATPSQTTDRTGTGGCSGNPSIKQSAPGSPLHAAETVVAAGQKRADARSDIRESPPEITGTKADRGGRRNSAADDDPEIPVSNSNPADATVASHQDAVPVVPNRPRERSVSAGAPGRIVQTSADMHGAVAFDAKSKDDEVASHKPPRRDPRQAQQDDQIAAPANQEPEASSQQVGLPGVDDRIPWMALTVGAAIPTLRPPQLATPKATRALKPNSRAECQQRCGSDGFCDPSSELGCGGMHCGWK
jgi:hypothetical protein